MPLQVDTVFVWVNDLEESLAWYRALGLAAGPRYDAWQTMEIGGEAKFALHQGKREAGPSTAVISFRVDDLQAEIERVGREGIRPVDEITETGAARFATFVDPDGNEIQLLER
jgi:predicted enzyme related to lactoylglutathione lyase